MIAAARADQLTAMLCIAALAPAFHDADRLAAVTAPLP